MKELKLSIYIEDIHYNDWVKEYGRSYVRKAIINELQMSADNIDNDVMIGYEEIY